MIRRGIFFICHLLLAAPAFSAETPVWIVRSLPSASPDSTPLLVQTNGDAAPEWGVLTGNEVTIADISPDYPERKLSLPAGTALFDLRDMDRDGRIELASVRAGRLEYWADATIATETDPAFTIEDAGIAALSIGGPRPYPLFIENRGEDFITVPVGGNPPVWTLEGIPLPSIAPPSSSPMNTYFHSWSTPADASANRSAEIRVSLRYERESETATSSQSPAPASGNGGTRRARDASAAPAEEWPWFALSATSRVLYALAPPDFRDTLIRVDRRDLPGAASATAPNPRRFPGVVIAPGESGSDFNGDGFNDLLLWRAPRPGASLDALVRAAQDGDWTVDLSVHLFNPATGRYDARPINWIHTEAPLEGVLAGGVRGPFGFLGIEDLDGNGRVDVLCSGTGSELVAWTFTGRAAPAPWARVVLPEPIEEIELTARVPAYHWLGIVRTAHAFHLVALPKR